MIELQNFNVPHQQLKRFIRTELKGQKKVPYEWSYRAKTREVIRHTEAALAKTRQEASDYHYINDDIRRIYRREKWPKGLLEHVDIIDKEESRRRQCVWELLYSEIIYLTNHLLVLRNVYQEPLKECQVEGCLLRIEPQLLFGNLDDLCQVSYNFCTTFIKLLEESMAKSNDATAPTSLINDLFQKISEGSSTLVAYKTYCINYKKTMEYLEMIRRKEDGFLEFEKVCMMDDRCKKLRLEDLLISPLHRITRLPLLLKEIYKHTRQDMERDNLNSLMNETHESLRSIDDSLEWLSKFERLQELQSQLVWTSVLDVDPKTYVPEFLRLALSRQFCENLIANPRRLLIHEGPIRQTEGPTKQNELYVFLFNDMLLLTKPKKSNHRKNRQNGSSSHHHHHHYPPPSQPTSSHNQSGGNGFLHHHHHSNHTSSSHTGPSGSAPAAGFGTNLFDKYVVLREPIPLDVCAFVDVPPKDAAHSLTLANSFVILQLSRFYQVMAAYTFQADSKASKDLWIGKLQEAISRYEAIELSDLLRSTPLSSVTHNNNNNNTNNHNGGYSKSARD